MGRGGDGPAGDDRDRPLRRGDLRRHSPHDDTLHHLSALALDRPWQVLGDAGDAGGAVALTTLNSRLWAVTGDGRLRTASRRGPGGRARPFTDTGVPGPPRDKASPGGCTALAGRAGTLYAAVAGGPLLLCARPAVPAPVIAPCDAGPPVAVGWEAEQGSGGGGGSRTWVL